MGDGIQLTRAERIGILIAVLLSASAGAVDIIVAVLIPNLGGVLIPVLAFSVGAQNATLPEIDKIQVNTAFITGNLEKLGEAVASLFRKPGNRDERLKLLAFGSIWTAYAFGAAIGALAARQFGKHSLLVPASILCITAILVFSTQSRSK
jgi:uncharacterized membrane protein YoaK (UPF0700 family)